MLNYNLADLTADATSSLRLLQDQVDAEATHPLKLAKATLLFKAKKPAATFTEIKRSLLTASPAGEACYYCERDRHRDIDHIRPKRHYPEFAFCWSNYVFSCSICNQDRKSDKYAVFGSNNEIVVFDRHIDINVIVPVGDHVLIDIRAEDPLDFLMLDLQTGEFLPIDVNPGRSRSRAIFSRDLFRLNDPSLSRVRRQAADHYATYLHRHKDAVLQNDAVKAARMLEEIRELQQPTVLVEMRRQSLRVAGLAALFVHAPLELGARP